MKQKVEHERGPPQEHKAPQFPWLLLMESPNFFITIHKTQLRRDYAAIRYYH